MEDLEKVFKDWKLYNVMRKYVININFTFRNCYYVFQTPKMNLEKLGSVSF